MPERTLLWLAEICPGRFDECAEAGEWFSIGQERMV